MPIAITDEHQELGATVRGVLTAHGALAATRASGDVTFFSRSRNKLWRKGESSGHVLRVREILLDCDADALVVSVDPVGPGVCHEGYESCFFRKWDGGAWSISEQRAYDPNAVYKS